MGISVWVYFLRSPPIAAHTNMAILVSVLIPQQPSYWSHCSQVLHNNFSQRVNPKTFSHCSHLQPTLTWQLRVLNPQQPSYCSHCSPVLHGVFSHCVIPQTFSHCSPARCSQLLNGNFSQGVLPQKSSHCSSMLTLLYGNFSQWRNSSKVLPLQLNAATLTWHH